MKVEVAPVQPPADRPLAVLCAALTCWVLAGGWGGPVADAAGSGVARPPGWPGPASTSRPRRRACSIPVLRLCPPRWELPCSFPSSCSHTRALGRPCCAAVVAAAHAKVGWVSGSGGIPVGKIEQGNLELGHESVNGPKEEGGGSRPKNIGFFAFGADRGLLLNFLTHIRNTS